MYPGNTILSSTKLSPDGLLQCIGVESGLLSSIIVSGLYAPVFGSHILHRDGSYITDLVTPISWTGLK